MDLVDLIIEKKFIGQEFLTWLWFKSEEVGFIATENGEISFSFVKQMTLEEEREGESEKVVCHSEKNGFGEAKLALRNGKKIDQARIVFTRNDTEYKATISASTLELKSIHLPKTSGAETEKEEEMEGMILERIFLFEAVHSMVGELLISFYHLRISEVWPEELLLFQDWMCQLEGDE